MANTLTFTELQQFTSTVMDIIYKNDFLKKIASEWRKEVHNPFVQVLLHSALCGRSVQPPGNSHWTHHPAGPSGPGHQPESRMEESQHSAALWGQGKDHHVSGPQVDRLSLPPNLLGNLVMDKSNG